MKTSIIKPEHITVKKWDDPDTNYLIVEWPYRRLTIKVPSIDYPEKVETFISEVFSGSNPEQIQAMTRWIEEVDASLVARRYKKRVAESKPVPPYFDKLYGSIELVEGNKYKPNDAVDALRYQEAFSKFAQDQADKLKAREYVMRGALDTLADQARQARQLKNDAKFKKLMEDLNAKASKEYEESYLKSLRGLSGIQPPVSPLAKPTPPPKPIVPEKPLPERAFRFDD